MKHKNNNSSKRVEMNVGRIKFPYTVYEGSTEDLLSQQETKHFGKVNEPKQNNSNAEHEREDNKLKHRYSVSRHEACPRPAGRPPKNSKEIIDACWGKCIPKPTAPFLTEEALGPKGFPTSFFTPVKIDWSDKFAPGYGKNIEYVKKQIMDWDKNITTNDEWIDSLCNQAIDFGKRCNELLASLQSKEKTLDELNYESAKLDGKIEAYEEIICFLTEKWLEMKSCLNQQE